jgi:prepilin-type N-terminal cleavage/methylation domain-containing protein
VKGFSLVELLVATTLMSVIAGAGLSGLLQASASARVAATAQRLQERAQYAFATLEADIQMAGYFGIGGPPSAADFRSAALPGMPCDAALLRNLQQAVEIRRGFDLDCAAAGGGALPDAPLLILRRASARTAAPERGRVQWFSSVPGPDQSQLLWQGALPAGLRVQADRSELRNLLVRSYYLARGADGDPQTPSLRVKSLTSIAGAPAFIDTEVMPGVEAMQIETLPDAAAPISLQIRLLLREDEADRGSAPAAHLWASRRFALRNARSRPPPAPLPP